MSHPLPRCRHRAGSALVAVAFACAAAWSGPVAAQQYEDALRAFSADDYATAVIHLKNVLQANPDDLAARTLLGRAHLRAGNPPGAEKELEAVLEQGADPNLVLPSFGRALLLQRKFRDIDTLLHPDGLAPDVEAEVRLIRAESYMARRNFDSAEEQFVEAARLSPDDIAPVLGQVMANASRGRLEPARELALAAVERAPEVGEVWFVRGEVARMSNDAATALDAYTRATEIDPRHVRAHVARAATLLDVGRDEEAAEVIEQVLTLDPENFQAMALAMLAHSRAGEQDAAARELQRASEALAGLRTDFIRSHEPTLLLAGFVAYAQGRVNEARDHLEIYLERIPNHAGARRLMARVDLALGSPLAAREVLRPLLQAREPDAATAALMGQVAQAEGRHADAVQWFERSAELASDAPELRRRMAASRMAVGRTQAAISDLEAALGLGGSVADTGPLLVRLHLQSGNARRAAEVALRLAEERPEDAALLQLAATALEAGGDLEEAAARYAQVLEADPSRLAARNGLASIAARQGREDEAIRLYDEVLAAEPGNIQALAGRARVAAAAGRIAEAVQWLEKARAHDPDAVAEHLYLVDIYLRQGKQDEALQIARALERRRPEDALVLEALARTQRAAGLHEQSNETLIRIARVAGSDIGAMLRAARLQLEGGDPVGARASLERAAAADPDGIDARAELARLDLREGRHEVVLAAAETLRERWPENPEGYALGGDVMLREQRIGEAAALYLQGLEKAPDTSLIVRRVQAVRALEDAAAALTEMHDWMAGNPSDHTARQVLASLLMETGDRESALAEFERVAEARPGNAGVLNNLANLYLERGDDRALTMARRAHAVTPDEPAVLDTLGWVLVRQGDVDGGLSYLRQALTRASREPSVRYHMAFALAELGRHTEAREHLDVALASDKRFAEVDQARALREQLAGG